MSLNLVVGFTGLLSVTHAAFYGLGAYATALLMTSLGVNFFLSILIGMAISGLSALVIGYVLSRFDGDYFALGSFGFNIIVFSIFLNWQDLTRGPLGIPGIPRPTMFGYTFTDNLAFLALSLVMLGVVYVGVRWLTGSSFGRALKAIREDEKALQVFGYATSQYKLAVFVISAMIAGIAGSFFATYISYIDPTSFVLMESIFILMAIILGGLASHKGAIVGAVCLILLPEILRFVGFPTDIAAQMRQVVYGVLLVVLMIYRPQGFVGEYKL